jgi:uncharacterized protein YerC
MGMRFEQVKTTLQALKGDGTWGVISEKSGVSYDTIARIARGEYENPGVRTIEKISDVIEWLRATKA